jgi:signal transduction histidine kinase
VRRRLLTSYLALTLIILIILEVPLALSYGSRERDQVSTRLERDAYQIANYSEETLEGDAHARIQAYVAAYARRTGGQAVVVDAHGRVVGDSRAPVAGSSVARRPELVAALSGHTSTGSRAGSSLDDATMFAATPVFNGSQVVGAVRVTYGADKVNDRIHRYWLLLGLTGLACLAVAALIGVLLSRWVTQPLTPMREAAIRLGQGDLSARVGRAPGPPEVRDVAVAFDEMASRLEELVDAQEAFVADASHQLRTPLTALRLRLENLESEVPTGDALDDLAGARRETQRMSRLIDGLLTLARADRGSGWADRQTIGAGAATEQRLEIWRPIAEEFEVQLEAEPSDLQLRASPDRLAQVLDNLLANATDASPPGSRLQMTARSSPDGRWVEVHVIDQGPGLDADQRRRAFDRFWRGSATVTGDDRTNLGGSGLGLSIVRRLVSVDGGHVELREGMAGGIDAVVSYPAADPGR